MRPAALALLLSRLPAASAGRALLSFLCLASLAAWVRALCPPGADVRRLGLVALAVLSGLATPLLAASAVYMHEAWAGVLLSLALALRRDGRFAAASLALFLACVVRELALPAGVVLALIALRDRRPREAFAFAGATLAALGLLGLQAFAVSRLTSAGDIASPGWLAFGGLGRILAAHQWNLASFLLGAWSTAALVPLALAGGALAGLRGRADIALIFGGFCLGMAVIGRADNCYWGLVDGPLMGVALCWTPEALTRLWRNAAP